MLIEQMEQAVEEASVTINRAKSCVRSMAHLCAGRLRDAGVRGYTLEQLKRELRDYNIHTGTWKDR